MVCYGSSFILLHVNIQLFQHHLLKRLSSLHWVFLAPLSNISWLYVYIFISGLLCSISLCVCFYVNTILFRSLEFYNIAWNQEMWYFLLRSPFSEFLWLLGVFYNINFNPIFFTTRLSLHRIQIWKSCIIFFTFQVDGFI